MTFLIIAAVLGGLAAILAVSPKKYQIVSDIIINQPVEEVFDYVRQLRNQEHYSKWVMADPNIALTYTGTDGTVGAKSAWKSEVKDVGVGEQEITAIIPGRRYDAEIRFEKPFKGISQAYTTTEPVSANQTRVTTVFNSHTPFPMNAMVPVIKKMLKKDMDENARRLKAVLEK